MGDAALALDKSDPFLDYHSHSRSSNIVTIRMTAATTAAHWWHLLSAYCVPGSVLSALLVLIP